jgi:hypothetical protein
MNLRKPKTLLSLICFAVILLSVFEFVSAIILTQTRGLLKVQSSDPSANLVISQVNTSSVPIGYGSKNVRLKPGKYQVLAKDNSYQVVSQVSVYKKRTTEINLKLVAAAGAPSSYGLFSKLPFIGPASEYTITENKQAVGNTLGPVITISATDTQAQNLALQWITSEGYNPKSYMIQYKKSTFIDYHYTNGLP